jgi:elongation factor 2
LKDLQEEYMGGTEIRISDPVVSYRETFIEESKQVMTKSPNKHNRLYLIARPMDEGMPELIDDGTIGPKDDPKARGRLLAEKYGWDKDISRKIWAFGPDAEGPNMVIDVTKGVQYMNEIKDHVVAAFQWAMKEGPLASESVRGGIWEMQDCVLHTDAIHRGGGQLIPTARRAFYAAMLKGQPRLMEPIFLVEMQAPENALGGIYNVMNTRRGNVFEENQRPGTPIYTVKCYLPVNESFGFTAALRAATSGQAFPQCVFDHWELMDNDPMDEGTQSNKITMNIRERYAQVSCDSMRRRNGIER